MNILIVVDKIQSAIHRLALPIEKYNKHFNVKILAVHPKRNDVSVLSEAQQLMKWADLIDIHYWKSGEILRQAFPTEFTEKPRILFHFNPYDVDKQNWTQIYNAVVVGNEAIKDSIPYAYLIPYGIDLSFWKYQKDICDEKVVNMSVARIESKKGVLEVAKACKELGYAFHLAGRVSEPEYMNEIFREAGDKFKFFENITDEELREVYYKSAVHVCNSVDGFESGTLPILENMACGTAVITRMVGHVPDLYDETNLIVNKSGKEDIEALKKLIKEAIENSAWRENVRSNAWQTVKNRNDERMARMISGLYYHIKEEKKPLVSIIVPTFDRFDALVKTLAHACTQDYGNIEIVVIDSGNTSAEQIIQKFRAEVNIPIKYIRFENKGEYTLPKARNLGIIESEGEILVFCDDRLSMEKDAVSRFLDNTANKCWLWGVKDGSPKGFVENFSSVMRRDLIMNGMFNERIDGYGGATQDIRMRFEKMGGYVFKLINEAKAASTEKSGSRWRKKDQIVKSKLTLFKLYGNN